MVVVSTCRLRRATCAWREQLCYNVVMTVSYDTTLLRDKLGGPIANDKLWGLVTSVGKGDAYAYSHALLAIDWVTWRDFESRASRG